MTDLHIKLSPKFDRPTYSAEIKLRDICSQLTMALYGKSLTTGQCGCLGSAQTVKTSRLKNRRIIVSVQKQVWEDSNPVCVRGGRTQWKDTYKTLQSCLTSVINHGKSKGLDITLELIINSCGKFL